MKPIERSELLGLAEYEKVREHFRGRIIAEKRARRVALGPNASCVFENRDTALMQIQEMLRTERITRPAAIDHEVETYNQLVPGDHELSATVLVEIDVGAARCGVAVRQAAEAGSGSRLPAAAWLLTLVVLLALAR